MTLLERPIAEPTTAKVGLARSESDLRRTLDAIARLWRDHSQLEIAYRLGVRPGTVSGLIARARRNGDGRFPGRSNAGLRPKAPPKRRRVVKPVKVVDNILPLRPASRPRLLIDLEQGECRWAGGDAGWQALVLRRVD
jgi:hypothetical protein